MIISKYISPTALNILVLMPSRLFIRKPSASSCERI